MPAGAPSAKGPACKCQAHRSVPDPGSDTLDQDIFEVEECVRGPQTGGHATRRGPPSSVTLSTRLAPNSRLGRVEASSYRAPVSPVVDDQCRHPDAVQRDVAQRFSHVGMDPGHARDEDEAVGTLSPERSRRAHARDRAVSNERSHAEVAVSVTSSAPPAPGPTGVGRGGRSITAGGKNK